jgi:hypothetical protein
MLSLIGIAVVFYIITKASRLFDDRETGRITSTLAGLTIIISFYVLYCLITGNIPFPAYLSK